jgi:AmmeMemoRadiSam system protein A
MLSEAQKTVIIELARRSVVAQVTGARVESARDPVNAVRFPDVSGLFVTIKRRGELRGCLGTLQCRRGLAMEVVRCAADAASEDYRFAPVRPEELPDLSLEVSVLGPLEAVDPAADGAIVVGRHGLVIEHGVLRGLLLPQVATEHGWTREQFLQHTCSKAGLPINAWHTGAKVYRFEADVFGEGQGTRE